VPVVTLQNGMAALFYQGLREIGVASKWGQKPVKMRDLVALTGHLLATFLGAKMDNDHFRMQRDIDEIKDALRRILAILRPQKCSAKDLELLAKILPAIGGYLGDKPFSVWELMIDPALAAIMPTPAGLGSLLARAVYDQVVVDGLQVEKLGRIHNATKWRLTCGLVYAARERAENGTRQPQGKGELL
jgi:hypothetical protein